MTSIGAAKARLVEILSPALPAVAPFPASQVVHGPVDVTTLRARTLEVGGESTSIQLGVSSLDGSSGTERYTLILTASVSLPGADITVAEDRALADFAAAVVAIRADPSLGLDNLSATVSGNGELVESANAQGRSAAVRFPVSIFATL